jgi:hypothetical protein
MATIELWRYEARLSGRATLAPPVVAALLVLFSSAMLPAGGFLVAWVPKAVVPLAPGFAAVGVAAREPAPALQRPPPTGYAATLARRLAIVAMVTVPALLAAWPYGVAVAGFAMTLIGVGVWGVVRFRSGAAASGVMIACWLTKLLIVDAVGTPSVAGSVILAGLGAALLMNALGRIGREEA